MKTSPATLVGLLVLGWLLLRARHADAEEVPFAETKRRVLELFGAKGYPPREAEAAIRIESGWRPHAVEPHTHAVGLLQFLPSHLSALGFMGGWQAYARLSSAEQLPYIERFLRRAPRGSGIPGDTYVLMAAPRFVGSPADTIVYPVGSRAWQQNPGWHAKDEPVTVESLRRVLLSRM